MKSAKNILEHSTQRFLEKYNQSQNWQVLGYVLGLFVIWRIALLFIVFIGLGALPTTDFYKHLLFFPNPDLEYWGRWANWDGVAYLDVAARGYFQPILTVYFPVYPIAIRLLSLLGLSYFWAGLLLSQLFAIITLYYLYKIVLLDYSKKTAKKAVFALLVFPASFYLVVLYNESLILALATAAFYYARNKRWALAAVLAGLAGATRLSGLAVILGVTAEYLWENRFQLKFDWFYKNRISRTLIYSLSAYVILDFAFKISTKEYNLVLLGGVLITLNSYLLWGIYLLALLVTVSLIKVAIINTPREKIFNRNLIFLVGSLIPLSTYLIFQKISFNSYFTFLHQEKSWGKVVSLPWQGPLLSLNYLFNNLFTVTEYAVKTHLRFIIFLVVVVCIFIIIKKLRTSYAVFSLTAFAIPLFSGSLIDFPRYALLIFPIYIIFSLVKNDLVQKSLLLLSIMLLTLLMILFFNSYFFM